MTKDSELIYEKLLDEIITLKIKPGSRLREVDVAEEFKVSRTPIRDVFKKLEDDGLLEIKSQRGTYVSKIDLADISDYMYIRDKVEYAVLKELTRTISLAEIADLKMVLHSQTKELEDFNADNRETARKFFDIDNYFHEYIYKKANRLGVLKRLNESNPCFTRYRFLTFLREENEIENLCHIHYAIVDCLENKDLEALRKVVMEHNFSGIRGIELVKSKHPTYFN